MKTNSILFYWRVVGVVLTLGCFSFIFSACSSSDDVPEGLVISGISPSSGPKATVVTIAGSGFNSNAVDNVVTLNSIACTVISASSKELKIAIPPKGGSGKLSVTVNGKTGETPLFTYVNSPDEIAPVISSISPLTGPINTVVTITGSGFSANAVDNSVTLNDKNCTVTSASTTELKVIIPSKAGSGRMKIKVNGLIGESPEFTYVYTLFTRTTFAGSTRGELNVPIGIAIDSEDNVYVADIDGHDVKKITPSGAVSILAGKIAGQFINPYGIAVDSKGNVYVSDRGDNKIKKITPTGEVSTFAGNTVGEFKNLFGLAVDRDDNVYVADYGDGKVKKITPSGVVSTFVEFTLPSSIAIDGEGNVYVGGPYQIKKITGGVAGPFAGSSRGDGDKFDDIRFIALDKDGNVYATDYLNTKVKKISSSRSVSTIANSPHPYGIAVDKHGDVYVALAQDAVIVKIVQE